MDDATALDIDLRVREVWDQIDKVGGFDNARERGPGSGTTGIGLSPADERLLGAALRYAYGIGYRDGRSDEESGAPVLFGNRYYKLSF